MTPTEPTEHHLRVARTARYWLTGGPFANADEVWFVCHGYAQLARRFLRRFEAIAETSRLIVAPEALNRFYVDDSPGPHGPDSRVGATWMTCEDRLADIDDYVGWLDALHAHILGEDSSRLVVALGFSQGTATVARWANRTRRRIDHVVLWSGGLPPELEPGPRLFSSADLTLVAGESDLMVSCNVMRRTADRLRAAGFATDLIVHEGGHRVEAAALAPLLARLRVNRRA